MPLISPVTDIARRCKAKDLAAMIACDTAYLQRFSVLLSMNNRLGRDPSSMARSRVVKILKAFELRAQESAGLYSVGDELSIADVSLVSMVQAMYRLDLALDVSPANQPAEEGVPIISRIIKACETIPAFQEQGIPKIPREARSKFFAAEFATAHGGSHGAISNITQNDGE